MLRLCWVSEGQQLLSTGSDGLLKLWTVKTRQCVQTFDEHQGKAWAMAVSEDEKRLVTGAEDAALVMWRDVTQEEKDKAAEEAARYIHYRHCCVVFPVNYQVRIYFYKIKEEGIIIGKAVLH